MNECLTTPQHKNKSAIEDRRSNFKYVYSFDCLRLFFFFFFFFLVCFLIFLPFMVFKIIIFF